MVIYIVSDGKKGHLSQTRGLAEALLARAAEARPNIQHSCHEVSILGKSWLSKLFYKGKDLDLPRPHLILCAGHSTHLAALSLSRHLRCLCMVCMRPSLPISCFDLCITPRHDVPEGGVPADNTFLTNGAINCIKPHPEIAKKNITVIWIGGRDWPVGGWEYNLKNDVLSANVVFKSEVQLWQVPRNVYRMMPVSHAELWTRVRPYGAIGKYLAENVVTFNNEWTSRPREFRILGDSPAVGLILYNDCGEWEWKPAPEFDAHMNYVHNGKNRPIKVYKNIEARFILEDLYAKLELANKKR